ncbi:MAG: MurR/RpiR family transcriptional regulator [Pilosibacter sp.]
MGILEEVNASYEKLSPVQKRIADFIFKYPDQVCFYSLKELSETLGVTEVTILRFTKKSGAQSFVEMKNRLREHLQTRLVHGDGLNRLRIMWADPFGDHDKEEMFQEFVANEKNVIAKTFEQVSS